MANPQKENGHLDLANELVEQFQRLHLSGNEWMILWTVWRKTYAWHKKVDAISLSQFQDETGLSRPSVSEAILKLVGKRVLLVDKSCSTNNYSFNKDYDEWSASTEKPTTARVVRKTLLPSTENGNGIVPKRVPEVVPKRVHTKEKKETITKETTTIVVGPKPDKRNPDLEKLMEHAKEKQFALQGSVKENRQYAWNLLRNKEIDLERACWLVGAAVAARGQPYAPRIEDFKALFYKWADLLAFYQKEKGRKSVSGVRITDPSK